MLHTEGGRSSELPDFVPDGTRSGRLLEPGRAPSAHTLSPTPKEHRCHCSQKAVTSSLN